MKINTVRATKVLIATQPRLWISVTHDQILSKTMGDMTGKLVKNTKFMRQKIQKLGANKRS